MSGIFAIGAMVVGVLIPVGVVVMLGYASLRGGETTGLHRGALLARWGGFLLAAGVLVLGLVLAQSPFLLIERLRLGALAGAVPLLAAVVLVIAIACGELTLPAVRGTRRVGLLTPRGVRTTLPRVPLVCAIAGVVLLVGLTVLTTAVASPDEQGHAGRRLSSLMAGGDASTGAFPGQWYTVPMWAALGLLLLCAAVAVATVVLRRPSDDPQDLLLRRRSAVSLLGAVCTGAGATAVPVALLALRGFSLFWGTDFASWRLARWGTGLSAGAALVETVLLVAGLAMVCLPGLFARGTARPAVRRPATRLAAAPGVAR